MFDWHSCQICYLLEIKLLFFLLLLFVTQVYITCKFVGEMHEVILFKV